MGSTLAQRIKQMTIKIKNLSGKVIFTVAKPTGHENA